MKRLILIDTEQHTYKVLLTIPEASPQLGISRATVYRRKREGLIKFEKVGRNVYITEAEIRRIR